MQHTNCSGFDVLGVESCEFGKFCCLEGCCVDYTYFLILLIVVSMVVTVGIFVHVEFRKEKRLNAKLKKHMTMHLHRHSDTGVDRIQLGSTPIENCPFNHPPSCSPPMTVPKLKFHKNRPIRHFLNKHW